MVGDGDTCAIEGTGIIIIKKYLNCLIQLETYKQAVKCYINVI